MSNQSMPTGPGTFCWMELATRDTARAKAFYTKLFGWTTEEMDMGPMGTYTMFQKDGRPLAGMMAMSPQMPSQAPAWQGFVATENVDASTTQARELGGKVLTQPTDIPNIGRFSVIEDPTGVTLALFQGNCEE